MFSLFRSELYQMEYRKQVTVMTLSIKKLEGIILIMAAAAC